jgi:hypothetical protein
MTEDHIMNIYYQELERFQYQLDVGKISLQMYDKEVEALNVWLREELWEARR